MVLAWIWSISGAGLIFEGIMELSFFTGRGAVCLLGRTRIFSGWSKGGGDHFFFSVPKGVGPEYFDDQNFFMDAKGGPEKNGHRPSQTDAPPSS